MNNRRIFFCSDSNLFLSDVAFQKIDIKKIKKGDKRSVSARSSKSHCKKKIFNFKKVRAKRFFKTFVLFFDFYPTSHKAAALTTNYQRSATYFTQNFPSDKLFLYQSSNRISHK